MSKSVASSYYQDGSDEDEEDRAHAAEVLRNTLHNRLQNARDVIAAGATAPASPTSTRQRLPSARTSDLNLHSRMPPNLDLATERTGLLSSAELPPGAYRADVHSAPGTPRPSYLRSRSTAASSIRKTRSRQGSLVTRIARALGSDPVPLERDERQQKSSMLYDDRVWYDQFTSTDWVHDSIADAFRVKELRLRRDWRGRLTALFDGSQGWLLVVIVGCLTAGFAYFIDVTEATIFDYKTGYCTSRWILSKSQCCSGASICDEWRRWSSSMNQTGPNRLLADYLVFIVWVVVLATLSCLITLQTKTVVSSAISLATLDENLGADDSGHRQHLNDKTPGSSPTRRFNEAASRPPLTYYPAAGSGVAEVKVILSGFVLHGYLGVTTLIAKTIGIILAVASGMSLGKEGPYVHIATCIGNVACRLFSKYSNNDGKRREILSAAAASGVAVAFGAPISGVLFSLEEVSYYFPPKTLFRTYACCIAAALSLKFLNPYGNGKIVLFEVRYLTDWRFFELVIFIAVGILGGGLGALFIKASRFWATTFRRVRVIRKYPILEVSVVALITGLVSFWNRYTRLPVAALLYELAAPCDAYSHSGTGLCPTSDRIAEVIRYLCVAFVIKAILTIITFGIKVPAGIYVPSMVVGGLLGRIVGHTVQLLTVKYPNAAIWSSCSADGNPEGCVVPGVYALVAAGATMCGVTRLSVTLAVILFELTGSLEHVLPFSLGVLVAKWVADAVEPLSIYDLLTDMNAYPYLDAKVRPIFTTDLGDITSEPSPFHCVDISASPLVPATHLRRKLEFLHVSGELDGGLPILREGILVGLIPAPDLEFALDRLEKDEENALCLMSASSRWQGRAGGILNLYGGASVTTSQSLSHPHSPQSQHLNDDSAPENPTHLQWHTQTDPTDFTSYVDPAPVALDISSPMDLVFECFVKLGLRYICVLREGKFAGLVHKKTFVRYVKQVEREEHLR